MGIDGGDGCFGARELGVVHVVDSFSYLPMSVSCRGKFLEYP